MSVSSRKEARYCYGVSLGPNGGELARLVGGLSESSVNGPEARGLEVLDRKTALEAIRGHEREGLCHSVWTRRRSSAASATAIAPTASR